MRACAELLAFGHLITASRDQWLTPTAAGSATLAAGRP